MKSRTLSFCIAAATFSIQHSAFSIAAEPPAAAAQEGVQLWEGGPFWADRNVGAEEPWEYGFHFWWGDTLGSRRGERNWVASDGSNPRADFIWFPWRTPTYGKDPDTLRREGWTTEDDVLAPAHDAARAHWGGDWRMPTKQELLDLCYNKCDWTWTATNGVDGAIVRGRGDYADASIFLPATGWNMGKWEYPEWGFLWASDPRTDSMPGSWRIKFARAGKSGSRVDKCVGYHWDRVVAVPVRPVCDVPGLTGAGSGAIELAEAGADGPCFRIFVMDCCPFGGWDNCRTDQIAWYERVAADGLPHLWFQHVMVPDVFETGLFREAEEGEEGGVTRRVHGKDVRIVLADGVDRNGIRLATTKAVTTTSYNDGDPGVRLIVVHPDGSFETEIGTLDHPFPVRDDGRPYRPAAPQPLPRAAPAAASAPAAAESPASPHHQSHGYWLGSIFFLLASELA